MNDNGLSCRELVELVTDYLEDALSQHERASFESHVAICEGCETYLDQIKETVRLTGRLTEDQLSRHASEALLQAFRDWQRTN
jgi:anti-sigma factor RsiW